MSDNDIIYKHATTWGDEMFACQASSGIAAKTYFNFLPPNPSIEKLLQSNQVENKLCFLVVLVNVVYLFKLYNTGLFIGFNLAENQRGV